MRNIILVGAAALSLTAMHTASMAQEVTAEPPTSADALNGQSLPAPESTTTVITSGAGMPDTVVTDYPGNMASVPPVAMNKHYPVCTARLQDNCQNPGEGGAPGRSRALRYWPGKPASE